MNQSGWGKGLTHCFPTGTGTGMGGGGGGLFPKAGGPGSSSGALMAAAGGSGDLEEHAGASMEADDHGYSQQQGVVSEQYST